MSPNDYAAAAADGSFLSHLVDQATATDGAKLERGSDASCDSTN